MQFVTVEGRSLKCALRPLVDTIERRSTIPILGYVRLTLEREGLRLSATDLDVEVETRIDVIDGDRAGWSLCLPAQALANIAQVAGVMPVRIVLGSSEEGAKTTISLGDDEAVYTLDALPAADFPSHIVAKGALLESFGNGQLAAQLDKVRAFISSEETRYYLGGVCWHRGPLGSRFVATDGYRLGCCRVSADPVEAAAAIIPRKAVGLICKHLAGLDVRVHGREGGSGLGLVFEADGLTIRTKLIDGTYPDFDKIVGLCVDRAGAFAIALKRPDISAALARLRVFGRDIGRAIRFDAQDGRLVLARSGGDDGGARAKTASPWPEGLSAFGLNAVYFGDMVAGCSGDITLGIASAADPLLVRDGDPEMTRILMPMRV